MTTQQACQNLETLIVESMPLAQVVTLLREYRDQGLAQLEAVEALDRLRDMARDEPTEDRILEVMDIVSGFCSPHLAVW